MADAMLRRAVDGDDEPAHAIEQECLLHLEQPGHAVVLFDGVCLLCSRFIHFIVDHDPSARFQFAPLQSELGTSLLDKHGLKPDLSTVVLLDERGVHVRSTAALRILLFCGFPSYLLYYMLILVPRPVRDLGYTLIAASRYRLFGKDEGVCRRMTKDMRQRFLAV
mmetsp:Transcript_686/g.1572  ORF Transcript_686/g.1572 Transcript_686/m.1572 type:complete len:165 (-) Transcript_686:546-1040(-)